MKALVTGGAGFLGRHFVPALLERGYNVTVVDDMSGPFAVRSAIQDHLWFHQADAEAYLWRSPQNEHYDLAIHLAAPVGGRMRIELDPLFNAGSLRLDAAMFTWAIRHAGLVIYPSSSAVYGVGYQVDHGRPLYEALFDPAEDAWGAPDEVYGLTKMVGEVLAWKAAERYDLSTLAIRPFSGYGEDQGPDYPMPAIVQRALRREDPLTVWGGEQSRDWVHVDDIVAATFARIDAGVKGYQAMNIGSGVPTTFRELAALIARTVGYGPRISGAVDKPVGVQVRYAEIVEMSRYWSPRVSLEEGIRRMVGLVSIDVIIPATRPVDLAVRSLQMDNAPDNIIIVSNEIERPAAATLVGFWSDVQPIGSGDAGLRRDIGAWVSEAEVLLFFDDDQVASRGMLDAAWAIALRDGFCWGHHRYIDFPADPFSLMDKPPSEGRSRENGVNRWHGWQSSYAGLLAIRRDLFWQVGGFDLAWLGYHGHEDQHLGRRLAAIGSHSGFQTYVHEPPFAWHPETPLFHSRPRSNIMGAHALAERTIDGQRFSACAECPYRVPLAPDELVMSDEVVVPFDPGHFEISVKE